MVLVDLQLDVICSESIALYGHPKLASLLIAPRIELVTLVELERHKPNLSQDCLSQMMMVIRMRTLICDHMINGANMLRV